MSIWFDPYELGLSPLMMQIAVVLVGVGSILVISAFARLCIKDSKPVHIEGWDEHTGKVHTMIFASSSFFNFEVRKVAHYTKRQKWSLCLALIWVVVIFSKQFTEKLTGNAYGMNLEQLCHNSTTKLIQIEIEVRDYLKLEECYEQVMDAVKLTEDGWNVGRQYQYNYGGWYINAEFPNACDKKKANNALMESRMRMCEKEEKRCKGDEFDCVWIKVHYPCPGNYAASQDTLAEFLNYQSIKPSGVEVEVEEQPENDMVAAMLDLLLTQIDTASNLYIGYMIAMIWLSPPVLLYKSSAGPKIKRGCCQLNQFQFIIFVILFWNTYTYMILPLRGLDMAWYFNNFLDDPCYLDPKFNYEKLNIINEACFEVAALNVNFTDEKHAFTDLYYYAKLYDVCYERLCASECNGICIRTCTESFWRGGLSKANTPFIGNCNNTVKAALIERYASPNSDASTDPVAMFITSGFLAQMLIKMLVSNTVRTWYKFSFPWIFYDGQVEVSPLDKVLIVKDITWYLRWQNFLPLILWSVCTAAALFNLWTTMRWEDVNTNGFTHSEIAMIVLITIGPFYMLLNDCWITRKKKKLMKVLEVNEAEVKEAEVKEAEVIKVD